MSIKSSSPPSEGVDIDGKRKKRNLGQFLCPECGKTFTRTDHLSRHHLNHKPKEVFECDFMLEVIGGGKRKCGKTFVRRDLKDRHMRRHLSSGVTSRVNWSSVSVSSDSILRDSPEEKESVLSQPRYSSVDSPLSISNIMNSDGFRPQRAEVTPKGVISSNDSVSENASVTGISLTYTDVDTPRRSISNNNDKLHSVPSNPIPIPQHIDTNSVDPYSGFFDRNNVMQSQNELISWLFNDTVIGNGVESSPMDIVVKSPEEMRSQNINQWENGNLYNFRNYDLAENDVFHTDLNPLDQAILQSYMHDDPSGGAKKAMDERSNFLNLSLPSSGGLTSPTSTNESNPTPTPVSDVFSPSATNIQKKIHEYGSKFNVATNKQTYIDKTILHQLFTSLPQLQRNFVELIFNDKVLIEDRFSYYLAVYWLVFHPQFNILHKPSFKTDNAEPLLLLSMILIGCNYCTPPDKPDHLSQPRSKSSEYKLALAIATPLRFAVFQNDGFRSPVKLWVLQTLNLLEWSEKNFLSRTMHERGHIHHGTTVQLLRRSPALGGNPAPTKSATTASDGEFDSDLNNLKKVQHKNDAELFEKWVESESLKRVTFITFYLDIADYIKFRHNPVISFNQLQLLKFPCDDELWEAPEVNGSFSKVMKKQKKLAKKHPNGANPNEPLISALKKLLKSHQDLHANYSPFVKKILFGGLLSIMYQMQQLELNNSSSLISMPHNTPVLEWKTFISDALNNFNRAVCSSCKSINLDKVSLKFMDQGISACKFSLYHLAHIFGISDLNTYDVSIYCGSPANQNVNISMKDRMLVERKLQNLWIKPSGQLLSKSDILQMKGIVHCYIFLFETLLDTENKSPDKLWNPDRDYFDSMFSMSLVMQALWSYCFITGGPESNRYTEIEDNMFLLTYEKIIELSVEDAYEYLKRIKQEFTMHLRRESLHHSNAIDKLYQFDGDLPSEIITRYAQILSKISHKQNISGLCFLVGTRLYNSQWEVVRENGKLIINCGFRSIGKKEVLCSDVFDVELLD